MKDSNKKIIDLESNSYKEKKIAKKLYKIICISIIVAFAALIFSLK